MNDKTFKIARLIRLAIFLGILFSFALVLRWDIGATGVREGSTWVHYTKLDRWTGATYGCMFVPAENSAGPICAQEQP